MFHTRLKQLRLLHGYTQQYMANYIGLSLNAYQKYEQGAREPSLDTFILIADIFNVSADYLLGRDKFLAKSADGSQTNPPACPTE